MDVTQENMIQVWRVMVLHGSTHELSFEVGGSLKGKISIQIIKTARLKYERTGMVLKYLLNQLNTNRLRGRLSLAALQ